MEKLDIEKVGENIKMLREEKGLTQEEVCKELENYGAYISERTLYKYEQGQGIMKIDVLYALSKIFDREVTSLFPTEENIITVRKGLLSNKAIKKINKLRNERIKKEEEEKKRDLLKIKNMEVRPISEIELLNEIILNTDVLETIVKQEEIGIQVLKDYLENNRKVDINNNYYVELLKRQEKDFSSLTEEQKEKLEEQQKNIVSSVRKSRKELEKEKDLQLEIAQKKINFELDRLYLGHIKKYKRELKDETKEEL